MKRILLSLAAVAVLVVAALVILSRADRDTAPTATAAGADSVWYRESDVSLLGRSARPQLVEFFHPG